MTTSTPELNDQDFTKQFHAHVGPKLFAACKSEALLLALDLIALSTGHSRVMRLAIEKGASYLPDDEMQRLDEWIGSTILEQEAAYEPLVTGAFKEAERLEALRPAWEAKQYG